MRIIDRWEGRKKPEKEYSKSDLEKIMWIEDELYWLDKYGEKHKIDEYIGGYKEYLLKQLWKVE